MKRQTACLIPVLFLLAQGALCAQDQATSPAPAPDKAPRRLLFVMEKSGLFGGGYSDNEMIVLKRSFLTALSEADDAPTPIDYSLKSFPSSVLDRNKVARDHRCGLLARREGIRRRLTLNQRCFLRPPVQHQDP